MKNKITDKSEHTQKVLRLINERLKGQELCSKKITREYNIPFHEMRLSDELVYERNINRALHIIIYLDKTNQLQYLERGLMLNPFLTTEEKILKKKIEQYRKRMVMKKRSRNLIFIGGLW